jgi:hypothetical protein
MGGRGPEVRNRLHVFTPNPVITHGIAVQRARQLVQVEMRRQQVAPPKIENRAVVAACRAVESLDRRRCGRFSGFARYRLVLADAARQGDLR